MPKILNYLLFTWRLRTGEGQGDVLADDRLFSISSGKSTDPVFMPLLAYKNLRWLPPEGLDGAVLLN